MQLAWNNSVFDDSLKIPGRCLPRHALPSRDLRFGFQQVNLLRFDGNFVGRTYLTRIILDLGRCDGSSEFAFALLFLKAVSLPLGNGR